MVNGHDVFRCRGKRAAAAEAHLRCPGDGAVGGGAAAAEAGEEGGEEDRQDPRQGGADREAVQYNLFWLEIWFEIP